MTYGNARILATQSRGLGPEATQGVSAELSAGTPSPEEGPASQIGKGAVSPS